MNHIVINHPLTKLEGGLQHLHKADEEAAQWLQNMATIAFAQ